MNDTTNPSRALGADGPGTYALEAPERTWVFHDLTQADKAEFALWCKQRVAAVAEGPLASAAIEDLAAGRYDWPLSGPRDALARMMRSVDGCCRLIQLLLRKAQPWATVEQCEQLLLQHPKLVAEAIRTCLSVPFHPMRNGDPA